MKNHLVTFLLSAFLFSCTKAEMDDIPALPNTIQEYIQTTENCTCDPYINLYKWNNKYIYVLAFSGPVCNTVASYYDEKGQLLADMYTYSFDKFINESRFVKNIWTCK